LPPFPNRDPERRASIRRAIHEKGRQQTEWGTSHLDSGSYGTWRHGGVARRTSRSTVRNCRSLNHTLLESSTCTPSVGLNEAPGTDMGTPTLVYARANSVMRHRGGGGALVDQILLLRPSPDPATPAPMARTTAPRPQDPPCHHVRLRRGDPWLSLLCAQPWWRWLPILLGEHTVVRGQGAHGFDGREEVLLFITAGRPPTRDAAQGSQLNPQISGGLLVWFKRRGLL
jgi:hypothetical protein